MSLNRRQILLAGVAGSTAALTGCASVVTEKPIARVVVIGGGFGGATTAKYIRLWEPRIEVTLVERNPAFVSCPISNLVVAGFRNISEITVPYDGLAKHGVKLVQDEATAIDFDKKQVRLAKGNPLPYDRLVVAPGVDFQFDKIGGLATAGRASMPSRRRGAQSAPIASAASAGPLPRPRGPTPLAERPSLGSRYI